MDFNNKVVVITGGSKGFGKGLAVAFIKEGSKVVITGTNGVELTATAKEIGAEGIVVDASSYEATSKLANSVVKEYGTLDIWINNAGIQIAPTNAEDIIIDKLHMLFNINFFGYFYGCIVALKTMKKQGYGLIINVNSTAGLSGKPMLSAYVSSKFAIKGMSESIREEIKDSNVKLHQIFPGGMQTDIYHEKVPSDIDNYMQIDYVIDKVIDNLKADIPEEDLIIKRPTIIS